jgi:glycosyltransferase involved in cell wall biosynthesis
MKILIVSQYFYPEDFKVNDIAFDFVKRGHEVTVFTAKPNYPQGKFYQGYSFFGKSKEVIDGVNVIRIPIIPRFTGSRPYLIMNYVSFILFSYLYLYRVKGNYDVVFSHLPSPLIAALPAIWLKKKFNAKLYLWVLDLWPESVQAILKVEEGYMLSKLNKLVKYIYEKTDVILISSNSYKDSILQKGIDKNKKIAFFPNWAENVFTDEKDAAAFEPPFLPKGFNIMFAGNLGDAQDLESILEAAKLTQNEGINWILVGEGRKSSWIYSEIEKHKLPNIYLLGRYPLESMPLFFANADAMLVSLRKDPVFTLTIPAKIQSYMASSKIILGMFDGEGKNLINQSGCGYAVDAGDYNALCQKAIFLKNLDTSKRKEMEQKSKEYYENNFSKTMLFDFLENDFKE